MKEKTQLGSLIEGGDLVDGVVTYLSQKLRISGKLGQIIQVMMFGWIMTPKPPVNIISCGGLKQNRAPITKVIGHPLQNIYSKRLKNSK